MTGAESILTDDGAHLAATTTGQPAAPPVLLCHGGPGLWDYLEPVAQLLPGHRVHRFDQRGCGRSSGPPDYSMARAVADIETLRAHWGYDRWHVFGHSFGATLALAYAWTYPDRVDRLVYCSGTGPGTGWKADYRAEEAARMSAEQLSRREQLEHAERDAAEEVEYLTLCWCTDYPDQAAGLAWARQDATETPYAVNFAANRALSKDASSWPVGAVAARCRDVSAPVLVMHGEADPRPLWNARRIAELVPNGQLAVIPAAGHKPWREDAVVFTAELSRFLGQPVP